MDAIPAPAYIDTAKTGKLGEKIAAARSILSRCGLCPRKCRIDRRVAADGICKTGIRAVVSAAHAHFGEEAPLVGTHGSGTIFFTGCNLMCNFCQNFDISHLGMGRDVSDDELAAMMRLLQDQGCHNINLVTPSHVIPQILSALEIAIQKGLLLPIVYNSGGYDDVGALKLLDGVVDIYMPDAKFFDDSIAAGFLAAGDFASRARDALLEMHRQVGNLALTPSGAAYRGLLIRHLVMPSALAGTSEWARWIAEKLSPDSYINIMGQYRPCFQAGKDSRIDHPPTADELAEARSEALAAGLSGRGFITEK